MTGKVTVHITHMTDTEIALLIAEAQAEQQRRAVLAQAVAHETGLRAAYLATQGQKPGGEYIKPTGAHNAYPKAWEVTHDGKRWMALRDGAHELPGESHDWQQVAEPGEILEWWPPQAGTEYPLGAIVTHQGHVWRNEHDRNGWQPGTPHAQWTDLGPVEDYEPEDPAN